MSTTDDNTASTAAAVNVENETTTSVNTTTADNQPAVAATSSSSSTTAAATSDDKDKKKGLALTFGLPADLLLSNSTRRNWARKIYIIECTCVLVFTTGILIAFTREIAREEANEATLERTTPGLINATTTPVPYDALSWSERYVLLGEDVLGSNYKGAMDVFFAIQLIAACSGIVGGARRGGAFIWANLFLLLIVWIWTFVILGGLYGHLPSTGGHEEANRRYRWAFAWCYIELILIVVTVINGYLVAVRIKRHKSDRYSYERAAKSTGGSTGRPRSTSHLHEGGGSFGGTNTSARQMEVSLIGDGAALSSGGQEDQEEDEPRYHPGRRYVAPVIRVSDYTTDGSGPPNRRVASGGIDEAA